jgi:uncharacterized protein (DUF1501 family)
MNRKKKGINRRSFLQAACYSAVASSSYGMLGALQRAHAGTLNCTSDYRAMVSIILAGGADSYDMIIPRVAGTGNPATDYNTYAASRQNMAQAQGSLLSIGDGTFGLHPNFSGLRSLCQNGRAAVLGNVGTMIEPVSKVAFENESVQLPPHLFSHNDQQTQWQTAHADSQNNTGWFGRVADLMHGSCNGGTSLSMNLSVIGSNTLQVGQSSVPYGIGADGPIGVSLGWDPDDDRRSVVEALLNTGDHLFASEYGAVKQRGLDNYDLISTALEGLGNLNDAFPQFGDDRITPINYLSRQLRIVAAMIAIRETLGANRQTFAVLVGGWDTHDNQLIDLPGLISTVDQSVSAFYNTTVQRPDIDSSEVTTFTYSEFGRTLNSNGNGTDHGWGGHHFVIGDSINAVGGGYGGGIYGPMPDLTLEGPQDTGRGRIIPTLSVEQYAAPIASWFGVPASDLDTVFPNLGNFDSPPSFMA